MHFCFPCHRYYACYFKWVEPLIRDIVLKKDPLSETGVAHQTACATELL
jgi:hypothetical protein